MAARTCADDRDGATHVELYLPAGVTLSVETNRFEHLWGRLFNHGVEPSE